jgi:hypothetical protein
MKFTQFFFPDGRREQKEISVSPEVEKMAEELVAKGCCFEIECFPDTQLVNADCTYKNDDAPLSVELVQNGTSVRSAIEKMVREAHTRIDARIKAGSFDAYCESLRTDEDIEADRKKDEADLKQLDTREREIRAVLSDPTAPWNQVRTAQAELANIKRQRAFITNSSQSHIVAGTISNDAPADEAVERGWGKP